MNYNEGYHSKVMRTKFWQKERQSIRECFKTCHVNYGINDFRNAVESIPNKGRSKNKKIIINEEVNPEDNFELQENGKKIDTN